MSTTSGNEINSLVTERVPYQTMQTRHVRARMPQTPLAIACRFLGHSFRLPKQASSVERGARSKKETGFVFLDFGRKRLPIGMFHSATFFSCVSLGAMRSESDNQPASQRQFMFNRAYISSFYPTDHRQPKGLSDADGSTPSN